MLLNNNLQSSLQNLTDNLFISELTSHIPPYLVIYPNMVRIYILLVELLHFQLSFFFLYYKL